jgi:Fe-Mn family superoxide dismutase
MIEPVVLPFKKRPGLSRKQLTAHYKLYRQAVEDYNELEETLFVDLVVEFGESMPKIMVMGEAELSALRNAIILHEMYFYNIRPGPREEKTLLASDLREQGWEEDFMLKALHSDPGWLVTAADPTGRMGLRTFCITDDFVGVPFDVCPLIVLDTHEHAYWIDYPGNIEKYVKNFLKILNWGVVNDRYMEYIATIPVDVVKEEEYAA